MTKHRQTAEYKDGVNSFLDFAFERSSWEERIYCPCLNCNGCLLMSRTTVKFHLERYGIIPTYTTWVDHGEEYENVRSSLGSTDHDMENLVNDGLGGSSYENIEEPNAEAKKFYRLLKDCETSLYPGCTSYTKMSFLVELLHLKALYKVSNKFVDELLHMLHKVLPEDNNVPRSYYDAKKFISDLGLNYQKIHACTNDSVLFRKEYKNVDVCPKCGQSRWMLPRYPLDTVDPLREPPRKAKKIPVKVVRYFPLTSRLQRYFMSPKTASTMCWHDESRIKDGVLRHPADTEAWKKLDAVRPSFGEEPRNVRLGLATDGFDPFSDKSHPYSMWPVVLIPYNVSPETCLKDTNYLLSMLIPGPKAPTNDIDVYLQPLIDELKDLWENGARTYDASKKENFQMYAAIIWTINDLPAYANLSGWATYGKLACPVCQMDTHYWRLKNGRKCSFMGQWRFLSCDHPWRRNKTAFDGQQELRPHPTRMTGEEVLHQLESLEDIPFGKTQPNRKVGIECVTGNWKKRSVFFQLPYWKYLLLPHNLDVMHIEKNVGDNLIGILLGVVGKNNDNLKARLDMKAMGIRSSLHPVERGSKMLLPPACYSLSKEQKTMLCSFLKDLRLPSGYSSNISRCVKVQDRKLVGLKSHDYHVLMQRLLSVAIKGLLPKYVSSVLIELSNTFRVLCSKELNLIDLGKIENQLPITMCNLERIFPPSFFNITVHLIVHLAEEARIAGPVQYRWMYSIER